MNNCRVAPSLGALEGDPNKVWGTQAYEYKKHKYQPTVFFGCYDLRDFLAVWRHGGKKWILWGGSDLRNFRQGFVLNDGRLRLITRLPLGTALVKWLLRGAEHWVETLWEQHTLWELGYECRRNPSFMGNVKDYDISFTQGNKVYVSANEGRQLEYGFGVIEEIADQLPEIQFYLYGAEWNTKHQNVIVSGRVPKEIMNQEIKKMQCGLRLNATDGFSEITAKSVLWGQWPITNISLPGIPSYNGNKQVLIDLLKDLPSETLPNTKARELYKKYINHYPWVHV